MLVRADTGRLLRESDLAPGGTRSAIVAWDTSRRPARSPTIRRRAATTAHGERLALEGEYRLTTTTGTVDVPHRCSITTPRCAASIRRRWWRRPAGFPRAQLEEAARLIWHARPVSYYAWSGHEQHANTTETARAMALLYALTGSFDAPGGNVLLPGDRLRRRSPARTCRPRSTWRPRSAWRNVRSARRAGTASRAQDFYRAVLDGTPYPMRGLIGFGSNTAAGARRSGARRAGARGAGLLRPRRPVHERRPPQLADIVLPVASCFEREALKIGFEISAEAQSLVQLRQAVVPPPGQARPGHRHHLRSRRCGSASASSSGTATSTRPIATSWRRAA